MPANGRHDRAMSVLETISRENKNDLPNGLLELVKVFVFKIIARNTEQDKLHMRAF